MAVKGASGEVRVFGMVGPVFGLTTAPPGPLHLLCVAPWRAAASNDEEW